jgi:ABC-type sugar transport system permease subunit
MAGLFRVVLYMPQIISSVVYVTLYKMMLGPKGFFGVDIIGGNDITLKLCALVFYVFWTGFGTNILLMSGAMGGIDDSVVEACYLDGCNMTKEFLYVTLPSIYPTITTFVVLDITTLFTNTMNLHLFFGVESSIKSIGYYLELNTIKTPGLYPANSGGNPYLTYSQLSALGVMITCFTAPLCILVRKFMERVGPSED